MTEVEATIQRVQEMEALFNKLLQAFAEAPEQFVTDEALQQALEELAHYYFEGAWMHDFEMDQEGHLPRNLRRGVLSEDGVYNFIFELQQLHDI